MKIYLLFIASLFASILSSQTPGDCPETATVISECGIVYSGNNSIFTDNCGGDKCGCVGGNSNPSNFDNDCNTTYVGGNCGSDFSGSIENSMWWRFTPTENCDYEISITPYNCCCAQGNVPDYMQVWIGQMNNGSVTSYLINDNSNTSLTGGITTTYTVPVSITNGELFIMLDGNAGAECDIDVIIQPSANCGDLCPILLNNEIVSFTSKKDGIYNLIELKVNTNEELYWELQTSQDAINWESFTTQRMNTSGLLKWNHISNGYTYYRAKSNNIISSIIVSYNHNLITNKIILRQYTLNGLILTDLDNFSGFYIEYYIDGSSKLMHK